MGLKDFKERLMNDKEYAKKFTDVKSTADLVDLASRDGYVFSVEDYDNNAELTDAELEAAARGKSRLNRNNFVSSNPIFEKNHFAGKQV